MIEAVIVVTIAVAAIVGGALFVLDKRAAIAGRRRIPERILLMVAALGAGPVMLWLSARIRHKTRKQPFRTQLIVIVILQALAAIALILHKIGLF